MFELQSFLRLLFLSLVWCNETDSTEMNLEQILRPYFENCQQLYSFRVLFSGRMIGDVSVEK